MLTSLEAKVIAGEKLVEKYGLAFVRENIDQKLFTGVIDQEDSYQVDFELVANSILECKPSSEFGIQNDEETLPECILTVLVNKNSGEAVVL